MALTLKLHETPGAGLHRIAHKRLQKLLKSLRARDMGRDASVHNARKQVKEFRGVLRLARAELGKKTYRRENQALRDAARPLSELRDASVLIDTLDKLIERSRGGLKPAHVARLKQSLRDRRQQVRTLMQEQQVLSRLVRCVQGTERRIQQWPDRDGGWKSVRSVLRRIYRKGRTAMRAAHAEGSNEALHEWRKRTNALRYALEFVCCIRPKRIRRLTQRAHRLTEILGEDHDLAVLGEVAQQQVGPQSAADSAFVLSLIVKRRLTLQKQAHAIGNKLFRETDSQFIRQVMRD
jgi:CHAD domain-containing protein